MQITALIHDCRQDGESGFAATCAEFPEANGQGETKAECLDNLRSAIEDILVYRREEAAKSLDAGQEIEMVTA